jgi:hypothetical protein
MFHQKICGVHIRDKNVNPFARKCCRKGGVFGSASRNGNLPPHIAKLFQRD